MLFSVITLDAFLTMLAKHGLELEIGVPAAHMLAGKCAYFRSNASECFCVQTDYLMKSLAYQ